MSNSIAPQVAAAAVVFTGATGDSQRGKPNGGDREAVDQFVRLDDGDLDVVEAGKPSAPPQRTLFRRPRQSGLGDDRLEELDRVARWVVEENLLAPDPGDDVVAEVRVLGSQPLDQSIQIIHL